MRYTAVFLAALGLTLLVTCYFQLELAARTQKAHGLNETAIILVEKNMSQSEISRVLGIDEQTPDKHAELVFRMGGNGPSGHDFLKQLIATASCGGLSLIWSIALTIMSKKPVTQVP